MRTFLVPLLSILLLLAGRSARAQQEPMISQYMFNGLLINPAYAGSHPYISGSMLHRDQWTNMAGAPRSSTLAFDAPLSREKLGVGLTAIHDRIGVTSDLRMDANIAYRVRTSEKGRLAFGLKAGVGLYSARLSELVYPDDNDAVFQNDISNAVVGRFGTGMYWSDDLTFIGFSIPTAHATHRGITMAARAGNDRSFVPHYYLNAGRIFRIAPSLDAKPSILLKYRREAPFQADLNLNVLCRDRLWLGAGYRTGDAVEGMIEYQLSHALRAGYAYDHTISRLSDYNGGAHEVMIGLGLGRQAVAMKTPRYF